MDGEMEGASPNKEGEAAEEAVAQEEVFDFSQDQRMQTMVAHLAESLENFKEDEHWKDEHYVRLNDFLTESRQSVLFFWNDFEEMTLRVSNVAPPGFYENPPKNPTDYQVAYFLKRRSDIPITAANL
jgi:ADP-heptose:LPS heptosyltransferase